MEGACLGAKLLLLLVMLLQLAAAAEPRPKGPTNHAAVDHVSLIPTASSVFYHQFPYNPNSHCVVHRFLTATVPEATDSKRVRVALGHRGGIFRTHNFFHAGLGVQYVLRARLCACSWVFRWVSVHDDPFFWHAVSMWVIPFFVSPQPPQDGASSLHS